MRSSNGCGCNCIHRQSPAPILPAPGWATFDISNLQTKPGPVKCLLSLEERNPPDRRNTTCCVDVHEERKDPGPQHLTEIVQQAQEEVVVDLITQLSATLPRNLSRLPVRQRTSGSTSSGEGPQPKRAASTSGGRTPSNGSANDFLAAIQSVKSGM